MDKKLSKILNKYKNINDSFLREYHRITRKYISDSMDNLLGFKIKLI